MAAVSVESRRVVCQVDDEALFGWWRCPFASVTGLIVSVPGIKKSDFWTVTARLPLSVGNN